MESQVNSHTNSNLNPNITSAYQHILVVITDQQISRRALERGLWLSRHTNAKLTLVQCLYSYPAALLPFLSKSQRQVLKHDLLEKSQRRIHQLVDPEIDRGVDITIKLLWDHNDGHAINQLVADEQVDLVVMASETHSLVASQLKQATDYQLLRDCPCQVLLVKNHEWSDHGKILSAIDTCHDQQHNLLNAQVIETSIGFAELLNANLHLLNAYPGDPLSISIGIGADEKRPRLTSATIKQAHKQEIDQLADDYHIPVSHTHVVEGLADDALPQLADDMDAELLVIGMQGRHGMAGAFVGNTAEFLVDRLNCDILAVKPIARP